EILHADEETMDSWDLQIAELFSRADAREIFGTLGAMNAVGTAESLLAEGVIVDESITASAASASGAGACECSESGTNYCWFTYCNKGTCQSAPSGCGTWWQQPCDGMCGGPRPVE